MRELLIVLQREFWERVRSKSFIISTIVTPLIMVVAGILPIVMAGMASDRSIRVAIVDESPGGALGIEVADGLPGPGDSEEGVHFAGRVARPVADVADSLTALMREQRLEAYLHLPPTLPDGEITIWSTEGLRGAERGRIQQAISSAIQEARAGSMGLEPVEVERLLTPVILNEIRITDSGEETQGNARVAAGFGASFLLYMMILLYGIQVLRSAQEEKANRISEILVSSVSAPRLMLGKVLGVGATALLQVSIWIAVAAVILSSSSVLARFGAPPGAAGAFLSLVGVSSILVVVVFIVLGFFLYATLFAALGAAAETMEDAQRFTFPLTLPLFIPLMMAEGIVSSPDQPSVMILSWVPLTAPLVMPARYFGGGASLMEVTANATWLVLCTVVAAWVAGRIYRAGILNTGKKLGWGDMVRWVRAR